MIVGAAMKRLFFYLVFLNILLPVNIGSADNIQKMNLSWSVEAENISNFKLYYSNTPDMVGKILHTECTEPVKTSTGSEIFTMTCTNIYTNTFPVYIQLSATAIDQQQEITSNIQKIMFPTSKPVITNIITK